MEFYQQELRERPRPVVYLVGLTNLHEKITNALTRCQVDPATPQTVSSLRVVSTDYGTTLPLRKDHLPRPDNYIPKGILKTSWLKNHTQKHPSVLALLVSWAETPTINWKAKEGEVMELIERTRFSVKSKNVRFLVVLVYRVGVDPDSLADERLSSLRRISGLSEKNFILFNQEDPVHSTPRLESSLTDFADGYYKDEARLVLKGREGKNAKAQPQLFVRNNFKVAFFSEFRQEWNTSALHYSLAHQHLQDCVNSQNLWEVKTVSDIINFKLCKIYLQTGAILKATHQFQTHMRMWKNYVGSSKSDFWHYGWLSRQYQAFGQLTETLLELQKVPELGPHHTGYYYQAAASLAIKQKQRYLVIGEKLEGTDYLSKLKEKFVSPLPTPLFIGQEMYPTVEGGTPGFDSETIAFAFLESKVNHSNLIINLLTRAYEHFKKRRKTGRMLLYLASQIGHEYHFTKNFTEAKIFFERVAKSYSGENWHSILQSILTASLDCALHLNQTEDFIKHAIHIIGLPSTSFKEKCRMQEYLISALQTPEELNLSGLKDPAVVKLGQNTASVVHFFVQFRTAEVFAHTQVECAVKIVSHFPLPLRFCRLKLLFNEPEYNQKLSDQGLLLFLDPKRSQEKSIQEEMASESERDDKLFLMPNQSKIYTFKFTILQLQTLECRSAELHLGGGPSLVLFQWDLNAWKPEPFHPQYRHRFAEEFERGGFIQRPSVSIRKPKPKINMTIRHDPPALSREYHEVLIQLTNEEDAIESGVLTFEVQQNSGSGHFTGFYAPDKETALKEIKMGEMEPFSTHNILLYVLSSGPNPERSLLFSFAYDTAKYHTSLDQEILSPVQDPFVVSWDSFLPNFQPLHFYPHDPSLSSPPSPSTTPMTSLSPSAPSPSPSPSPSSPLNLGGSYVSLKSPFFLCLELECNTPFPIKLKSVEVKLEDRDSVSFTATAIRFDSVGVDEDEQLNKRREKQTQIPLPRPRSSRVRLLKETSDDLIDPSPVLVDIQTGALESDLPIDISKLQTVGDAITVTRGSRYTVWYRLNSNISGDNINVGIVVVTWERTSGVLLEEEINHSTIATFEEKKYEELKERKSSGASSNSLPLYMPPIRVVSMPFSIDIQNDSEGVLGQPLAHRVEITNLTDFVLEFSYFIKENGAFLISGMKRANFKVLPFSKLNTQSTLIPVATGKQTLPQCVIQSKKHPNVEIPGLDQAKDVYIRAVFQPSNFL